MIIKPRIFQPRHFSVSSPLLLLIAFLAAMILTTAAAQAQNVDWTISVNDDGYDPVPAGAEVRFQIRMTNDGHDGAPATTVELDIPEDTIFERFDAEAISGCAPLPVVGSAKVTCQVPPLASQQVVGLDVWLRTQQKGTVNFSAQIPVSAGEATDSDTRNNSATQRTTVTAGADMSLSVGGPTDAASGEHVTYNYTARNEGPDPVSDVKVRIPVPNGLANLNGPAGCALVSGMYHCVIPGPLAVGADVTYALSGQIAVVAGSDVEVSGEVLGGSPVDSNPVNNSPNFATLVSAGSDLSISKTASPSGAIVTGTEVIFSLNPRSSGDNPNGITVTDTLPTNYEYISHNAPGWTVTINGDQVTATRPTGSGAGANVDLGVIQITARAIEVGSATNSASILADGPVDPDPSNNTATDGGLMIEDPVVDLRANKSGPTPQLYVVGNNYEFRIGASNVGNADFTGTLRMVDSIPAGLRVTSLALNGWTCSPVVPLDGPADLTCTRDYSAVQPLRKKQTSANVVVTTEVTAAGPINNALRVDSPNLPDEQNMVNNTTSYNGRANESPDSADISVRKTAGPGSVQVGDLQTFTIEVVNAGPAESKKVVLSDVLTGLINNQQNAATGGLGSISLSSGAAAGATCSSTASGASGRNLRCQFEILPVCTAGSDCPVVTVQVRPGGDGGQRTNTADVTSSEIPDPDLSNNTDSAAFSVTSLADLSVTKRTNPEIPAVGQDFDYLITVNNISNALSSAQGVVVTDLLPEGMVFISAAPVSGGGSCTGPNAGTITASTDRTVTCDLGTISNGQQRELRVRMRPVLGQQGTTVVNEVSVASATPLINPEDDEFRLSTLIADPSLDLLINKVADMDTIAVQDNVTYTITVQNLGPSGAQNVTITDIFPADHISFTSHTPSAGLVCDTVPVVGSMGQRLLCTHPYLAANESTTLTVVGTGEVKGTAINKAEVRSDEWPDFENRGENNEADVTTTVRGRVDVQAASKTAVPASVDLRAPFRYDIVIRNSDDGGLISTADAVVVTDNLPAGMELTDRITFTGAPAGAFCTEGVTSFTCQLGTMDSGQEVTLHVPVRVVSVDTDGQVMPNTVSVTTADHDIDPGNNRVEGAVTVNSGSISGNLFRDFNHNGTSDPDDTGIGGIQITLTGTTFDDEPFTATVTADSNGDFSFHKLPAGTCALSHDTITEARLINGTTLAGTAGGTADSTRIADIALGHRQHATGYLFPKVPQAQIGVAKSATTPVPNTDGSFNITFTMQVRNPSLEPLIDVEITDILAGPAPLFGAFASGDGSEPLPVGGYRVLSVDSRCGTALSSFNGTGNNVIVSDAKLSAGETCTVELALQIRPENPLPPVLASGGVYENIATVTGVGEWSGQSSHNNPDLADRSNNGTTIAPGAQSPTPVTPPVFAPAIALVKVADASDLSNPAAAGDEIHYSFTVTNTGDVTLTNVVLADELDGIELKGGPIATLAPGDVDSGTFTAIYKLTQADIDAGVIENTATVTGVASDGSAVTDISGTANDNDIPTIEQFGHEPSIALIKTSDVSQLSDPAKVGDEISYSFTVKNTGNVTLSNITLEDLLPGIQLSDGPIATLEPGEEDSDTFKATYSITQNDINAGRVQNTATVTGTPPTGPDVNDVSGTGFEDDVPTETSLPRSASISLIKNYAGFVDTDDNGVESEGDIVNFAFTVTNTGNLSLEVGQITDTMHGEVVTITSGPVILQPEVSGSTDHTDSTTFMFSYTVTRDDVLRGYIQNSASVTAQAVDDTGEPIRDGGGLITATATSDSGTDPEGNPVDNPEATETPDGEGITDGDPTNDPTVVQLERPEIVLEIGITSTPDRNGNGIFDVGDQIEYSFTVTNTGNVRLDDVTIDPDTLSLALPGFSCTPIPLEVGATVTLVCTGKRYTVAEGDPSGQPIMLGGAATGISPSQIVVTSDDSIDSPLLVRGDGLNLVKTAARSSVSVGDLLTYTLELSSHGDGIATTTNLVDRLPTGFSYRSGSARVYHYQTPTDAGATAIRGTPSEIEPELQGQRLIWAGLEINPGETIAIDLEVLVGGSVQPGSHVNFVQAFDPGSGRPVTPEASAAVRVELDAVFQCSTLIGRVFDDQDHDGYFNGEPNLDRHTIKEGHPGASGPEKGIPGVRLVTPNGLAITTDQHGRFSLPCAALPRNIGSNFMLKLDERTLPAGYRLTTENPRVVRLTQGMLTKMNFGATLSRVVRLDLSALAFDGNDLRPELDAGLRQMVSQIAATPSVLRMTYLLAEGETDRQGKARMAVIEKLLRRLWPANGRFALNIEKQIERHSAKAGE